MGYRLAVAVVARDGRLVTFMRNPDASPHPIKVAEGKAWTSNTFRAATSALQASPSRDFMTTIPGALIIGVSAAHHQIGITSIPVTAFWHTINSLVVPFRTLSVQRRAHFKQKKRGDSHKPSPLFSRRGSAIGTWVD